MRPYLVVHMEAERVAELRGGGRLPGCSPFLFQVPMSVLLPPSLPFLPFVVEDSPPSLSNGSL